MKHKIYDSGIKTIEETGRGSIIVDFEGSGEVEYLDVPQNTIDALIGASSVSIYFNYYIRSHHHARKPL